MRIIKHTVLPETGFVQIPAPILHDLTRKKPEARRAKLEAKDVVIYAWVKAHAIEKDNSWASNATLARISGSSVSSVQRSLKRLAEAGHIQRLQANGQTATTRLLTDVADGKVVKRQFIVSNPPPRTRASCPGTQKNEVPHMEPKLCHTGFHSDERELREEDLF